jgi:ABC-type lipoprotein export system ATPase subunit
MTMLLELKNLAKKFAMPSGRGHLTVLKNISLQVDAGESIAVVGPSGSGKSTLLNIMGTLDRPSGGEVLLFGRNLADCDDNELSHIRSRKIGFVFQLHHLLPQCTVLENVLIPTIPLGAQKQAEEVRARAKRLLERVGLAEHLAYFPAQLSGGEMQRVAVVRALINKPELVLADEPTGSLDKDSSENLGRLLVEINKEEGTALIAVTHSLDFARLMDKVFRLQNGVLTRETGQ